MRHSDPLSIVTLLFTLAITCFALALPMSPPAIILHENLTTLSSTTIGWHVRCVRINDPSQTRLQPTRCEFAIRNACSKLTGQHMRPYLRPPRDQWVWSDTLRGCSLGWFLPTMGTAPRMPECKSIFGSIVDECGRAWPFNAGAVNVEVLPSLSGNGSGIVSSAARYIMAPQQLTREDLQQE